jgi:hypothetical protein
MLLLNDGDAAPHLFITVIRYVLSCDDHNPESAPSPSQELIPESISKLFWNGFARENKVGARTEGNNNISPELNRN